MKKLFIVLLLMAVQALQAQITRKFNNTPLTEALRTIEQGQSEYTIAVLADGLADLRTYANVKNLSVPDAVKLVCKGLPVKVKVNGSKISVQSKGEKAKNKAQDGYHINGDVYDPLYRTGLDSVLVEVMTPDSMVVGNTFSENTPWGHGKYQIDGLPSYNSYIVKFSKPGFRDAFMNLRYRKGQSWYTSKAISMHRRINTAAEDIKLGTVTVKASLVKMVVDNDTIVYNAGAFQLAEGSMLDGLIKQLPGAEIRDNQIYVNGEFVQSLLVNGKDFFKGDPAIALENLPAYMVNKIKVFRRETEEQQSSGMKVNENDKELVMDVRLKREFNTGWAANVQGGLGTDNRWLARLFALRFTTNSRFAIYGNMNNTNDNRNPGESTDWKQDFIYDGMSTRKKGGAMWSLSIPKQKMDLGLELHAQHKDVNTESKGSRLRYLQNSDVWSRSHNTGKLCEDIINANGHFQWRADLFGDVSFFRFEPKLEYLNQKSNSLSMQAQLNREPYERYRGAAVDSIFLYGGSSALTQSIVNRVENEGKGDRNRLRTNGYWYASPGFPLPGNWFVKWEGNYAYENNKEKNYSLYNLTYPNGSVDNVFHHNYIYMRSHNYDYDIKTHLHDRMEFKEGFRTLTFGLIHTYRQQYTTGDRNRYLLEKLTDWSQSAGKAIDDLPSTRDEMQLAIDTQNSYNSALFTGTNTFDIWTSFKGYKDIGTDGDHNYVNIFNFSFHLPIRLQNDRLNYKRDILNIRNRHRHLTFFEPNASIEIFGYNLSWSLTHDAPDMLYLLPIRDDTDPLNISTGNENLRDTHHHRFAFRKEWKQQQLGSTSSFNINWHIMQNAIAMGRTYDSQTGVTTYQPDNVNGNWTLSATYRLNRPLDKAKRLFLSNATTVGYANSADLVSTDLPYAVRSSVRNANASEELSLSYKIKQYAFGGRFGVNWINAHSDRQNFETVNCENWLLGANAVIPLPWKMQLAADFSATLRTGYNDPNMNEAAFVCNARLSRSFFHGKLTMILDGFDIFNGIKDIRRTINEQGRTETWYNSVHRYVMLHAFYKFAKKPKK